MYFKNNIEHLNIISLFLLVALTPAMMEWQAYQLKITDW